MKKFQDFQLSEPLSRALADLGFETPSQIQAEAIPLLLAGDTDFLGLAATGTGKTAAFAIPLLERLSDAPGVQALILCPTRELAVQVAGQIDLLGKYQGVKALAIYGGTGYGDQIHGLKRGAQVVVGTPGRVVDHLEKGTLDLKNLKTLVLDEADEMISMGFQEDLEAVLKAAPQGQANIWLFSATMGHEVRHVADAYLKNPQKVQVNRTEMVPSTVEQIYFKVHEYDKPQVLAKLIDAAEDFYGIVFCQTKALVVDVNNFLIGHGYRADCLHGDMDQMSRDRVMRAFRERKVRVLVATDVACRGLDVKDVTHVVNYSIPRELDNYVHRIGRTGRNGQPGIAFSLVTFSHRDLLGRIERMTKTRLTEGRVPTVEEIARKRVTKVRAAIEKRGPQGRVKALLDDSWQPLLESLSKEELASRFLALLCQGLGDNPVAEEETPAAPVVREEAPQRAKERPARRFEKKNFEDKPRFEKKPYGKKNFDDRPRFEDKPRFEKKAFGAKRFDDKPRFEKKPYEKKSFDDKPRFEKKPYEKKSFEKKAFAPKFAKFPRKESESRTPPWERKNAPAAGPAEGGPRWKSPGTAKLGGKPRWKIDPSGSAQ